MIPLKRRDVVNADTQRWSPPAGMSPYLSASTILNPLRRPAPCAKRHIQAVEDDVANLVGVMRQCVGAFSPYLCTTSSSQSGVP
jgi:hypothetical protein